MFSLLCCSCSPAAVVDAVLLQLVLLSFLLVRCCFCCSQRVAGRKLPKGCKLAQYSPRLDSEVGGRLARAKVNFDFKHPYLIPADHLLASMIVYHLHSEAKHQGWHITSAAIRQAGYYLGRGGRVFRCLINNCFLCKKLCGKLLSQMMSELPSDSLEDTPPFQSTAIDVFEPFYIHKGRATRHTPSTIKISVVISVCLPSRAIHLEPLDGRESIDTASFINALSLLFSLKHSSLHSI